MASKFTLGLGLIKSSGLTSSQGGLKVSVFTGSFYDPGAVTQVSAGAVDQAQVISSEGSALAFHSTLFEDFRLSAEPVYNFYTSDEQTSFLSDPSASLRDLPRYVRVSWNTAPARRVLTPTTKGVRPPDPRSKGISPVMSIGVAKTAVANGYVSAGALQALLVPPQVPAPAPRFDQDLFLSSPDAAGQSAADHQHSVGEFHVSPIPQSIDRTRVNFVDPSIGGALDPNRVAVSSDHVHLASLGAFSKLAAGLEVVSEFNQDVPVRNPAPKFPAPAQTPGLMYTGYVLERYTLDSSGSMTLSKTVDIDDLSQGSHVDREVVFGGRYAYRIRSIVQWTRPANYGFEGATSLVRLPAIDTSIGSMQRVASFYSGDWSDWAKAEVADNQLPAPPDELTVRPVSPKGQVHVTWKMPGDPQRDISALRLLRSTVVNGRYGDWVTLGEFVPGNGIYIDSDVRPWEESQESYMYAMYSLSYHGEHSTLTERIEARITDRSRYLGEEPVRLIAPAGADPFTHAAGPAPRSETELVASQRATFYVRGGPSALPLFDRGYVVEVQSIATGQRAEIDLSVDTTDVGLGTSGGRGRA